MIYKDMTTERGEKTEEIEGRTKKSAVRPGFGVRGVLAHIEHKIDQKAAIKKKHLKRQPLGLHSFTVEVDDHRLKADVPQRSVREERASSAVRDLVLEGEPLGHCRP